jgi:glutathione synthase/RimK-type ligase-like ATP-grasp enzyme
MKIALITDQEHPSLTRSDQLLIPAFEKFGIEALPAVWDDPSIDWAEYDHLILRSCWDYYTDIARFESWLAMFKDRSRRLINSVQLVEWNLHKKYLFELREKGIRMPETTLIAKGDERTLGEILKELKTSTIVVKPCNGASAHGVLKIEKGTSHTYEPRYRSLVSKTDMLVQTFMPEISEGEYSAVFIGSHLSHVVLKKPKAGEFRSNGGFGSTEELADLSGPLEAKIIRIFRKCGVEPLFARLDFVFVSSEPVLMELELIEPYLFFELKEHSANLFASALMKFLK